MFNNNFQKGNRLKSFYAFLIYKKYNYLFFILFLILFNIFRCLAIIVYLIIIFYYLILIWTGSTQYLYLINNGLFTGLKGLFYRVVIFEPINYISSQFFYNMSVQKRCINLIRWFWYGYWAQIFLFCTSTIYIETCAGNCDNGCIGPMQKWCLNSLTLYEIWYEIIQYYLFMPIGENFLFNN